MNDATAVGAIFIAIMVVLGMLLISWAVPIRLWIEALASGVHVGLGSLVGMRLRKVSPPAIVRPLIAATKAGLNLDVDEFEAHYLAGGDVALPDMPAKGADFLLMDRKVIDAYNAAPEKNTSFMALIHWMGFRQTPCLICRPNDHRGSFRSTTAEPCW